MHTYVQHALGAQSGETAYHHAIVYRNNGIVMSHMSKENTGICGICGHAKHWQTHEMYNVCPAEQKECKSYVTFSHALIKCVSEWVQTCMNTEQNNTDSTTC